LPAVKVIVAKLHVEHGNAVVVVVVDVVVVVLVVVVGVGAEAVLV
jgi:hypothetical protein